MACLAFGAALLQHIRDQVRVPGGAKALGNLAWLFVGIGWRTRSRAKPNK